MGFFDFILKSDKPPESARTLGRNEPCWCKSGKKYKKCHKASDEDYFTEKIREACTSKS